VWQHLVIALTKEIKMQIVNNFYQDRQTVVDAAIRDCVFLYKNPLGNRSQVPAIPSGYESWSSTDPVHAQNAYRLTAEIQPLAAAIEQLTGLSVMRSWANLHKSQQWIGAHAHRHSSLSNTSMVKSVATYYAQVGSGETLIFEDQAVPVEQNMLMVFDADLVHGFDPVDRTVDRIVITFELG
jgi:hypothetical protein